MVAVTSRARGAALDVVLAAVIWALQLAELYRPVPVGSAVRAGDAWGVSLVTAAAVPLMVRRRHPRTVFAVVLVAAALLCQGSFRQSSFALCLVLALYTVGSHRSTRASLVPLAGAAALVVYAYLVSPDPVSTADVVQASLSLGLAWWVGAGLRLRAAYASAMEERAELVQRLHDEATATAVAEERLRIARELHDVLAHGMSVIAVQSGVARHLLDTSPDQARAGLDAIVGTSRDALAELRRLLGLLRQDGSVGALTPSPGLADLPSLVGGLGAAGLDAQLRLADPPPVVPPAIGLTAYRIVQEALTNVVRHAGAGARAVADVRVDVGVDGDRDRLVIDVRDEGGRRTGPDRGPHSRPHGGPRSRSDTEPGAEIGAGAGLIGMRERAALFGGEVSTAVTADGFVVHATLPLPAGGAS